MIKAHTIQHKHWRGKTFRFSLRSFRLGGNFSVRRFSITEAAFLLLMAYLASKGLGVIRQAFFNSLFGTGPAATAYYAAFRLPDTIFNLISGGALTHAFIPVLLSYEKDRGKMAVWRLSSLVFNFLLLSLVFSVVIAEFFAPSFVNAILVPGLPPQERALTTSLTRIMLLQPLILGLGTILTAILHSKRQFFPSALAIVIYDLGPIGGLLVARFIPGVGIYGPAYGLLAIALCQVAVQIPPLFKQGVRYSFTWNIKNPGLREVMRLLGPNILNVIVASAGAIVITYFASYLRDKTSIAVMHNAYMLFALPLTLVGQTIGNALLPQLTIQATHRRYARMSWTIRNVVGAATLLSVVAAIFLYAFGKPTIHLLFQYGAFSAHATALTSLALIGYAIGLPGQTLTILLALCFYSLKDVRTPLFANIFGLAVQIGCSLLLLRVLKGTNSILALPVAASISGTAQGLLLGLFLYVRLKAKVKTDRGMQRLLQQRSSTRIIWQRENTQQEVLPLPVPQAESPYLAFLVSQTTQPMAIIKAPVPQPGPIPVEQHSVAAFEQAVLQESENLAALMQRHIAMMTNPGTERTALLKVLTRICHCLDDTDRRELARVISSYNQAAVEHPDNADVYYALGQIHHQGGNYSKAIAAFQLAMSNNALEVLARFSIAQCLIAQAKPEAAVQQLELALQNLRLISLEPIDPDVWAARPRAEGEKSLAPKAEIALLLAQTNKRIEQQVDTQVELRSVKQMISFSDVTSTTEEIVIPQRNGTSILFEHMLNLLREVAGHIPQNPQPQDERVNAYIHDGLLNEAIAELRDLAIFSLRNNQLEQAGTALWRIGKIHNEVGDIEEAVIFLQQANKCMPSNLKLLRSLLELCNQLGRTNEAAHYQREITQHSRESRQFVSLLPHHTNASIP